jgi:hypothetical protein
MDSIKARQLAKTWLRGGYFYENYTKSIKCRVCSTWVSVPAYSVTDNKHKLPEALERHVINEHVHA